MSSMWSQFSVFIILVRYKKTNCNKGKKTYSITTNPHFHKIVLYYIIILCIINLLSHIVSQSIILLQGVVSDNHALAIRRLSVLKSKGKNKKQFQCLANCESSSLLGEFEDLYPKVKRHTFYFWLRSIIRVEGHCVRLDWYSQGSFSGGWYRRTSFLTSNSYEGLSL